MPATEKVAMEALADRLRAVADARAVGGGTGHDARVLAAAGVLLPWSAAGVTMGPHGADVAGIVGRMRLTRRIGVSERAFLDRGYQPITAKNAPRGRQLELLRELIKLYEGKGLLPDGTPSRLCDCCPHRKDCWTGRGRTRPKREGENGSVMLPWIGKRYRPGRSVAVLAVNPNIGPTDETDIFMEYGIGWEHHYRGLTQNERCHQGSWFAYRALRSAAALCKRG